MILIFISEGFLENYLWTCIQNYHYLAQIVVEIVEKDRSASFKGQ
jgi:hypothetical protein